MRRKWSRHRLVGVLARRWLNRIRTRIRTGHARFGVSRELMLQMSMFGLINGMSWREIKRRFPPAARALLFDDRIVSAKDIEDEEARKKREKARAYGRKTHRKKRKLCPSDYAWWLRKSGVSYLQPACPGSPGRSCGRKKDGDRLREDARNKALEFWDRRCEQRCRQKENARVRRLRRQAGLPVPGSGPRGSAKKRAPRDIALCVSKALYEAMSFGECISFNYPEMPGHAADFLPDKAGRPVEVVRVRIYGNDPDYDWISFEVAGLERFYRESEKSWYWRIDLGDRIPD